MEAKEGIIGVFCLSASLLGIALNVPLSNRRFILFWLGGNYSLLKDD